MTYDKQCATGRAHAAHAIQEYQQTGNAPKLVRMIREAAADESGFGAGFLFTIAAGMAA